MDQIKLLQFIFPVLISLLLLWSVTKWLSKSSRNKNLPPSPLKLPIFGNLLQLGLLPHRNLQSLAGKHGPLMLLHFGSVPELIVSTAAAARDVMKAHDLTFASRPLVFRAVKKFIRDGKNVGFAPYGEYWRQMRSTSAEQSSKRVKCSGFIREEESAVFMEKIRESSGIINLSKLFSEFTNNVICRSTFGQKYGESENGQNFLLMLKESIEVLGTICIGDFIPWLSWISCVNCFDKRVDKLVKEMDVFLEGVIQDRIKTPEKKGESFVDILLDIQNGSAADIFILTERASRLYLW